MVPKSTSEPDSARHNLVRLMQANDVTPADLAEVCNCTRELIYRYMHGQRRITDRKIRILADYFGVSESYFKYGSADFDVDKLGQVAGGAIEALAEAGVIDTRVSPAQLGNFIAQMYADYELTGHINDDQLARYIKMLAPPSAASRTKQ